MTSSPVLCVQGLTAGYLSRRVVQDFCLELAPGEICALVGSNGSGKSTILKAISGLARLFKGDIRIDGNSITHLEPWRRHRLGLCHIPQRQSLFLGMTVAQNLRLALNLTPKALRLSESSLFVELGNWFPGFDELLEREVATLSGGERQMAALARAVIGKPRVLLVDEPTQGLAEGAVSDTLMKLQSIVRQMSTAVLIVEHRVEAALALADTAIGINGGRVVWAGAAADLRSDEKALRSVFGLTSASNAP